MKDISNLKIECVSGPNHELFISCDGLYIDVPTMTAEGQALTKGEIDSIVALLKQPASETWGFITWQCIDCGDEAYVEIPALNMRTEDATEFLKYVFEEELK